MSLNCNSAASRFVLGVAEYTADEVEAKAAIRESESALL